jgi:hypothetical protein
MSSNSLILASQKTYPASLVLNFDETPFVDSSSYNNTVTTVGSVTTGDAKFGNYAGFWSLSGDPNGGLEISVGNEFNFGTGDFTIECWFKIGYEVWEDRILFTMAHPVDKYGVQLKLLAGIVTGAGCVLEYSIGDGMGVSAAWAFQMNPLDNVTYGTWHHVAVTRNNGIASLYLDGILIGSAYNSTNIPNYNSKFRVGPFRNFYDFWIDGLRVVKGAALYTGTEYIIPNIPPSKYAVISPKLSNHIVITSTKSSGDISGHVTTSTGYYTVNWWDGTRTTYTSGDIFAKAAIGGSQPITIYPSAVNSLLLNFNGSFSDSSSYNHTVTNTGGATISTSVKKYGSGAGNCASGSVSVVSNPIFAFNADFTIEGWFYFNTNNVGYQPLICADSGGDATAWALVLETNNTLTFYGSTGSGWTLISSTTYIPPINEWIHIVVSRIDNNLLIYANGSLIPLSSSSGLTTSIASGTTVRIGGYNYFPDYARTFNGYIDDVRVVKGKALYTSNFTPPTSELTSDVGSDVIGNFLAIDVSNNNLTSVRPFHSRFITGPDTAGYYGYYYYQYNSTQGWMRNGWIPAAAGTVYQLDITSNNLDSSALDQLYLDLLKGNGAVNVTDNIGGDSDNSSIATAKGYTVYGSIAPILSALFNFDGANNSTTFTDSSSYNHVPTRYGNTVISTTQSKFGGASAYFDGTGDYLGISTNSVFAMGYEDFTVECWAYPTSWPTSDLGAIVENRSSSSSGGFLLWLGSDQKWVLYTSANGNATQRVVSSVANATLNTWTHLVGVRKNGKLYLYVNGSLVGSTGTEGSPDDLSPSNTSPIRIGTATDNPGTTRMFYGYIDGLKIVKGKALYIDDFIIPSSAPTTSTSIISSGTTRLLLNCNGSNNSTTFTDSSSAARTVTRTNTVISTTQSKFGGASAYFSNSGTDALAVTNNFNLSNTDFTIEFFFYLINLNGATGNPRLFSIEKSGQSWGVLLNDTTPNFASYNRYGTSAAIDLNNTSFSYNTWYHFAMSKDDDNYRFFLDGSLIGRGVGSYTPTGDVVITIGGCRLQYEYNKLNAYIDDFRVVTGKSLYNYNFTPPTSQLTRYGVPEAPVITSADTSNASTASWTTPNSGLSSLTSYKLYVDGVLAEEGEWNTAAVDVLGSVGSIITVSAVNAYGEGPKSAPYTAT